MTNVIYRKQLIDRLGYASDLCKGKRVLDIGGQHPMNHEDQHPFCIAYRKISSAASAFEIFDRDKKPGVKFVGDLNAAEGRQMLARVLNDYAPEVILCMEILEHLNYPFEVMNILAEHVTEKCSVFITLPNNGNWVLNILNWHQDHNYAFFKSIAQRFVERSALGNHSIEMYPCMQRYIWYWWLIYIASGRQPLNWGFLIRNNKS